MAKLVPVIDLFSGPGGLAEGFNAANRHRRGRLFEVALSVEMDEAAHRTLRLRAFLRKFGATLPDEYYDYLNGSQSEEPDWDALYQDEWSAACDETPRAELGTDVATAMLRKRLRAARKEHGARTVLLGGPPCQSYSLAGRARNAGNPKYDAGDDKRLLLYKEYAMGLQELQPAVAVMENVKGILSARYNDEPIFDRVMDALRNAGGEDRYHLFTLSPETGSRSWVDGLEPKDFVVRAEEHGVPQRRHRVFVICIRSDLASKLPDRLLPKLKPHTAHSTVHHMLGAMPMLRSRLSRGDDGPAWQATVADAAALVNEHLPQMSKSQGQKFQQALDGALKSTGGSPPPVGGVTCTEAPGFVASCPEGLRDWLCDEKLTRLPNNETRGHIREDIGRYLYASAFASAFSRSPQAKDFPAELAPKHASWLTGKFVDRFRVQLADGPSTTITSHISRDGHYFIHPDPRQCRSLTVREAARLQTFPDNYLFHGGRTQQYVQVGNAVPPYLAQQIATQVAKVIRYLDRRDLWDARPRAATVRARPSQPRKGRATAAR